MCSRSPPSEGSTGRVTAASSVRMARSGLPPLAGPLGATKAASGSTRLVLGGGLPFEPTTTTSSSNSACATVMTTTFGLAATTVRATVGPLARGALSAIGFTGLAMSGPGRSPTRMATSTTPRTTLRTTRTTTFDSGSGTAAQAGHSSAATSCQGRVSWAASLSRPTTSSVRGTISRTAPTTSSSGTAHRSRTWAASRGTVTPIDVIGPTTLTSAASTSSSLAIAGAGTASTIRTTRPRPGTTGRTPRLTWVASSGSTRQTRLPTG